MVPLSTSQSHTSKCQMPNTVNQQILAAIKFGVSPRPVYAVYDRRICWRRQILAKRRNSPNSPNIIARQNLLIYSKGRKQTSKKKHQCNVCGKVFVHINKVKRHIIIHTGETTYTCSLQYVIKVLPSQVI